MNIAVIGAGYVGLTLSACLTDMGHRVICVEKDRDRLASIRHGRLPFYEPGLPDLVAAGVRSGQLSVTNVLDVAVRSATIVFVAVGTPPEENGEPDLSALEEATQALARIPHNDRVIAIKSTVPVGTTDRVSEAFAAADGPAEVACAPEFLSEGSAVSDFRHPHRVIIGTRHRRAAKVLTSLYQPLRNPVLVTDPRTAEMIKYASNAFLATKVSFINQIAMLCEQVGGDVVTVAAGMGLDPRIGPRFLKAGIGFGGSCLPKDTRALAILAKQHGVPSSLLDSVLAINNAQRERFAAKVEAALGGVAGKTLALFGLSFKGGTSDVRESPALDIAERLLAKNAVIRAFDPAAEESAARVLPGLVYCPDVYEAAEGADAIVILADWPEFERLDWKRLKGQVRQAVVIDGRGLRVAGPATYAGFAYTGPGTESSSCAHSYGSNSPVCEPSGGDVDQTPGKQRTWPKQQ
jgi:UDPglucose 6-dehydrogenase